jgi:hypothetical protein
VAEISVHFFHCTSYVFIFTNYGLSNSLGNFFKNSSGHPVIILTHDYWISYTCTKLAVSRVSCMYVLPGSWQLPSDSGQFTATFTTPAAWWNICSKFLDGKVWKEITTFNSEWKFFGESWTQKNWKVEDGLLKNKWKKKKHLYTEEPKLGYFSYRNLFQGQKSNSYLSDGQHPGSVHMYTERPSSSSSTSLLCRWTRKRGKNH